MKIISLYYKKLIFIFILIISFFYTYSQITTGPTTICQNNIATYYFITNTGTFNWGVPIGSSIIQNNGSNIVVKFGAYSGNVTCNSFSRYVTVFQIPNLNIAVTPSNSICSGTPITLTASNAISYSWSSGNSNITPFIPSPILKQDSALPNSTMTNIIGFEDIDGDGFKDIIQSSPGGYNYFFISRNKGINSNNLSNNFEQKVQIPLSISPTSNCIIEDLDGDGKKDIIFSYSYSSGNYKISIMKNSSIRGTISSSSFASGIDVYSTTTSIISSLCVEDIDGDGKKEIIASIYGGSNNILIFKNTSTIGSLNTSSFAAGISYLTGIGPICINSMDLDNDAKKDIVVSNINSNTVSVFKNKSTYGIINANTLQTKVDYITGTNPGNLILSDLDNDNKPEIIVSNTGVNTISIFKNTSLNGVLNNNSFASSIDLTYSGGSIISVKDIDGDDKKDIILNGQGVSIFKNKSINGTISINSFYAEVNYPYKSGYAADYITVEDLNGDFKNDIILGSQDSIRFYINGNPKFSVLGTDINGCTNTKDIIINILPTPIAKYSINNNLQCLKDNNFFFSDSSKVQTGLLTKKWNFGVSINDTSSLSNFNKSYLFPNKYSIKLLVTAVNGCKDSISKDVIVYPNPNLTITASQTSICKGQGQSVKLTGSGALNYTWTNGVLNDVFFVPDTTKNYQVVGSDINGCFDTANISIEVKPMPIVITTLDKNKITTYQFGASFQWYDCDTKSPIINATNQIYTATKNGNYAVIVNLNNCIDTSDCVAVLSLSQQEINQDMSNTIFPNPNNGNFNIQLKNTANKNGTITIVDMLGRIVYESLYKLNGNDDTISISEMNLQAGTYNIIIGKKDGITSRKSFVVVGE
jgi:hypothetical protein